MRFLVDTLTFAVPVVTVKECFNFLGLKISDFCPGNSVVQNYQGAYYYQGIHISYKEKYDYLIQKSKISKYEAYTFEELEKLWDDTDYTCYVHMSGKGSRTFESLHKDNFDWLKFLKLLTYMNCDFRRIDIAYDDKETDLVTVRKCAACYEENRIAGTCRTFKYILGSEECFYAGSPKSKTLVRIYDKKLERGYNKNDLNGSPWLRCEMQLRDENAYQLIDKWIETGDISKVFCGYLMEFLRFTVLPNDKKNSQRLEVCDWWKEFLGNAERVKFVSSPGSDYNLHKLQRFLYNNAASSIKTFLLSSITDPQQFYDFFTSDNIHLNKDQHALLKTLGVSKVSEFDEKQMIKLAELVNGEAVE